MKESLFSRAVLWLVFLFLLGPFAIVVLAGFSGGETLAFPPESYSLRWILEVWAAPEFRRAFQTSLEIGLIATVIALLLGIPVAYAFSRMPPPGIGAIRQILTSPLIIPAILVGLGLLHHLVLTINAPVYVGLLIGHIALLIPYSVRVVYASLVNLRVDIEDAAITLGASRLRAFFMIVLPNIRNAVIAAFFLAFVTSFNQVPVSLFLTGPGISTLPIEMLGHMENSFDPSIAALSTLLVLFTMAFVMVTEKVLGISKYM
ncbi:MULTISPECIES: ABC transporter permease [Janthinobacterium]|jgi:putative spermidine/putrescine transport system permease protein|uniref:ABC transporter permease subunit n=3 Tax=Janthinobacterium TaxID=29580 RepID=A0A6I1I3A1_9BURK|nr:MULTISPECIES: ABC transporter permease [Janthinobacterium]APA66586.1 spermidine/putrescine ABC transporter ATP-binding protein [Janthinobacterium sp. 1_2014MBL_MicDiv]ATD63427.1 spermidine/putrescine ABC transporter ATP-binding protein [Janthinobacterium svalbardensis]AYM78647.1 ABC transporter permease [Janthinobacterium agaricidamnosum]KAB8065375.1 ABC transporter permease subunit [Janthinobacterium violaceinigrum]MCC7679409.1 ABC transporter permease [Janthinobacterium sp. FW305-128]